jgi:hypothetical protein
VVVEEVTVAVDEGGELLAEEAPPSHPLEVAATAVVVGAVEDATGKGALQPAEEPLVAGVHPQCHLGLTAIAAEVALAGEDAEQVAHLQVGDVGHGWSVGLGVFHRQASPKQFCRRLSFSAGRSAAG